MDEEALAEMFHWWEYDIKRLLERGRGYQKHMPAKPRIDVEIEITSKGNLKAEWFPRDFNRWGAPLDRDDSDFLYWTRDESRGAAFHGRPSNELMFLHGVEHPVRAIGYPNQDWSHPLRDLNPVFLQACTQVVAMLKERLAYHFDVRMITDVFVEYEEPPEIADRWEFPPPKIVTWELADPEMKQAEAELAEIASMPERLGFSDETLAATWKQVEEEAAGVANADLYARTAKRLRESGYAIKRPAVERAMNLLRKHEGRRGKVIAFPGRTEV